MKHFFFPLFCLANHHPLFHQLNAKKEVQCYRLGFKAMFQLVVTAIMITAFIAVVNGHQLTMLTKAIKTTLIHKPPGKYDPEFLAVWPGHIR